MLCIYQLCVCIFAVVSCLPWCILLSKNRSICMPLPARTVLLVWNKEQRQFYVKIVIFWQLYFCVCIIFVYVFLLFIPDLNCIILYFLPIAGGHQRDVVCLWWPIAPSSKCGRIGGWGGGVVAGSQPMSTAVHITWPGAQMKFGDLPPYLTYMTYSIFPVRFLVSWFKGTVAWDGFLA